MIIDCEPSPLFTLHEYILPDIIARAMSVVSVRKLVLSRIKLIIFFLYYYVN